MKAGWAVTGVRRAKGGRLELHARRRRSPAGRTGALRAAPLLKWDQVPPPSFPRP